VNTAVDPTNAASAAVSWNTGSSTSAGPRGRAQPAARLGRRPSGRTDLPIRGRHAGRPRTPLPEVGPLAWRHRSGQLVDALNAALADLPAELRWARARNQGSETTQHGAVARLFTEGVCCANPGWAWMRGTNGVVRQYLRKEMNLSFHSAADLTAIETRLNERPRKIPDELPSSPSWHPESCIVATAARIRPNPSVDTELAFTPTDWLSRPYAARGQQQPLEQVRPDPVP
jgi:hypothetical protein